MLETVRGAVKRLKKSRIAHLNEIIIIIIIIIITIIINHLVTLGEGKGHVNWHQTVDFAHV